MSWKQPTESLEGGNNFERLIDDVLKLVLEQVASTRDLVNLCLLSRHLYLHPVPQLYRNIDLDLSRSADRRLLRRLAQPTSLLSKFIRVLSIKALSKKHVNAALDLCAVFLKLSNLHRIVWHGLPFAPCTILDTLDSAFPKAQLHITTVDHSDDSQDLTLSRIELSHSPILHHPAGSLLTSFYFFPESAEQLYHDFKADLILMLTRNRVLKVLWIKFKEDPSVHYPNMLDSFRESSLPELQELVLHTRGSTLFTDRELAYWRAQGGWEHLDNLWLSQIPRLLPFLGRTPVLRKLALIPFQEDSMDTVDIHLEVQGMDSVFASLKELRFFAIPAWNSLPHQRGVLPWGILKRASKLSSLESTSVCYMPNTFRPGIDTPTASEIQRLRRYCPDLTTLRLDIALIGSWAEWPYPILAELARFRKPIEIAMFIHREHSKRARLLNNWMDYLHVVRHMRKEHEKLHLPYVEPFSVGFKIARPWEEMQPYWDCCGYGITCHKGIMGAYALFEKHNLEAPPKKLADMKLDELEENKQRQLSMKLGWDRKGYGKDIKRREQKLNEDTECSTL
jgi:hypothetical protein